MNNRLFNKRDRGFIRQNKSLIMAVVKLVDIFLISYSYYYFSGINNFNAGENGDLFLIASIIVYEFFASINNVYDTPRGVSFIYVLKRVFTAWFGFLLFASFVVIVLMNTNKLNVIGILYWFFLTPSFIAIWHYSIRLVLTIIRTGGRNSRTVAIAGATDLAFEISSIINNQPWMGFHFMGFFDDRVSKENNRTLRVDPAGDFETMVNMAKRNKIDVIFITLPMSSQNRIKNILDELSDTTCVVYFIPDVFVFDLLAAKVDNFNGLPAFCVHNTPHGGVDGVSKRIFDIIFSSAILTLILIPMLIIAIGVKLSSPGPILFKQRRYGFRGEEINVWKFRTMRVCENSEIVVQATKNDPRITKFGKFLRKTSLDELPQFINALQGRMSIVGPRPHAIAHNEFYRNQIKGYMLRHNVKPGITGLAQIRGFRGETETLDKMEGRIHSDLEYIHNSSIMLDFEILLVTIFKGFLNRNAY